MEGFPQSHRINVQQAMATLDHIEMVALASMFERWAFTETQITPDHRTMLIQMSADYERIADFCGIGWIATAPESPPDVMAFMAREEVRTQLRPAREGGSTGSRRVAKTS